MNSDVSNHLKLDDFCRAIGKSPSTVRRLIRAQKLETIKYSPGDEIRIRFESANEFLKYGYNGKKN